MNYVVDANIILEGGSAPDSEVELQRQRPDGGRWKITPGETPCRCDPTVWRADGRWEHVTLRRTTKHGVRLYTAGDFHGYQDYFENVWPNVHKLHQRDGFERLVTSL
jgi:hypothetical protein